MPRMLILIALVLLAACSGGSSSPVTEGEVGEDGTGGDPVPGSFASEMLAAVNAQREAAGVPPLSWNERLEEASLRHSQDMHEHGFLGHVGSDGSTMAERVQAAGYDDTACGENVAAGQTSIDQVMAAWMGSAGHRANILREGYQHLGAARVGDSWTQNFGAGGGTASKPSSAMVVPIGDG